MKIAIVGATGLVGQTLLNILEEKHYTDNNQIYLYASEKSVGKIIKIAHKNYKILSLEDVYQVDFAFFCTSAGVSKQYSHKFMQKGAIVIDNSSAYRRNPKIPLVIPEINFDCVNDKTKLIANPNCSTIALALPVFAISKKKKINRIIISTYQAVSGAGSKGLFDLEYGSEIKFNHIIKNNIIPQIDRFLADKSTFEEDKIRFELNKIIGKKINISATCVRVPITNCHSESVNIEFDKNTSCESIKEMLLFQEGIMVVDDPKHNIYPMPIYAEKNDNILVGRIRKDKSKPKCINMFLCMNNIRKGAALNAVQIMEKILQQKNTK